jgi:hypothetical protein
MKTKYKILTISLLCLAVICIAFASGGKVTLGQRTGLLSSNNTDSYAASNVDTVIWSREANVTAIAFGGHFSDSVSITNIVMRYVVDGTVVPVGVGDTLTPHGNAAGTFTFVNTTNGAPTSTTYSHGSSLLCPITTATYTSLLPDQLLFIVTYAGSGQGVSTPTVRWGVEKGYSK